MKNSHRIFIASCRSICCAVRALASVVALAWFPLIGFEDLSAAEFRSGEDAFVKADEVIEDDLYILGNEVTIDGEVQGDVIAFGRLIKVVGTVTGDLMGAAQAIVISGNVGDDVRIAGQVLKIDDAAAISGDVIAAGFSLEATNKSSIDGDLVYGGFQALLAGSVGGKIEGGLANCEISGNVGGGVDLSVQVADYPNQYSQTWGGSPPPISFPSVPPGLTIRDTAQIDGGLNYESPEEAEIEAGAQIAGEIEHQRPLVQAVQPPTLAERAMSLFGRYATLLIIGLGVVLIAPRWTNQMSDNIRSRPLVSLALGLAGIVGFIVLLLIILVAMLVLAVTAGSANLTGLVPIVIVLGLSGSTMLIVGFWFFTAYVAAVVFSFCAGSWLLGLAEPSLGENRFVSLVVGLVLLAFIGNVPYLGSIIGWLVVLLSLGALVSWLLGNRGQEPVPPGSPQLAGQ